MGKRTCTIEGCGRDSRARGWCRRHYRLWQRNGSTDDGVRRQYATAEESFSVRTEWRGECLVWIGASRNGYGAISHQGQTRPAHRYAWERTHGPIPEGHEIDHMCWNTLCVNVEHLRPATPSQNVSNRSGPARGRKNPLPRNVVRIRDQYQVRITKNGLTHYLGVHLTPEEAAVEAEVARRRIFGEFAGRG